MKSKGERAAIADRKHEEAKEAASGKRAGMPRVIDRTRRLDDD